MAQKVEAEIRESINTNIDTQGRNLVDKYTLNNLLKDIADSFRNKLNNE